MKTATIIANKTQINVSNKQLSTLLYLLNKLSDITKTGENVAHLEKIVNHNRRLLNKLSIARDALVTEQVDLSKFEMPKQKFSYYRKNHGLQFFFTRKNEMTTMTIAKVDTDGKIVDYLPQTFTVYRNPGDVDNQRIARNILGCKFEKWFSDRD